MDTEPMICNHCSQQFEKKRYNQKYCSKECQHQYATTTWCRANMKTCVCGTKIKHTSEKCKSCQTGHTQVQKKTLGDCKQMLSVKGKHSSWAMAHLRGYNRSWNKELLSFGCQVCGYKKHVELAHIKPVSSFEDEVLLTTINDPNNLLVLCPNHHWEFDNHCLELLEIPTRSAAGRN